MVLSPTQLCSFSVVRGGSFIVSSFTELDVSLMVEEVATV